jgi:hypothetical protein
MVLTKIVMAGVLIIALMVVARQEGWAQRVGVTGSCMATQAPSSSESGAWYMCRQGILTGFPNLETDSCDSVGFVGKRQVWSCSAPLVSLPGY